MTAEGEQGARDGEGSGEVPPVRGAGDVRDRDGDAGGAPVVGVVQPAVPADVGGGTGAGGTGGVTLRLHHTLRLDHTLSDREAAELRAALERAYAGSPLASAEVMQEPAVKDSLTARTGLRAKVRRLARDPFVTFFAGWWACLAVVLGVEAVEWLL